MKTRELYEKLKEAVENGHGDDDVVIPVTTKEPVFGPSSVVVVKAFSYGFDWDSKKIFLYPDAVLTEVKNED